MIEIRGQLEKAYPDVFTREALAALAALAPLDRERPPLEHEPLDAWQERAFLEVIRRIVEELAGCLERPVAHGSREALREPVVTVGPRLEFRHQLIEREVGALGGRYPGESGREDQDECEPRRRAPCARCRDAAHVGSALLMRGFQKSKKLNQLYGYSRQ